MAINRDLCEIFEELRSSNFTDREKESSLYIFDNLISQNRATENWCVMIEKDVNEISAVFLFPLP